MRKLPFVALALLALLALLHFLRGTVDRRTLGADRAGEIASGPRDPLVGAPTLAPAPASDARAAVPEPAAEASAAATQDTIGFHGRILAREDRRPVTGAKVFDALGPSPPETAISVSGADGRFEVDTAELGRVSFRIEADGFATAYAPSGIGHETLATELVLYLERAAEIRAIVLDEHGNGIEHASVGLKSEAYNMVQRVDVGESWSMAPDFSRSAFTAADGTCRFTGLPPRVPFLVEIREEERVLRKLGERVVLRPGESRELRVRLGTGSRLTGRVIDEHDAPVAGLDLWLMSATCGELRRFESYFDEQIVARCWTDDDGVYALDDVQPGAWWIGPAPSRSALEPPGAEAFASFPEEVRVPEGEASVRFDFRVHRGLAIRGRVLDVDGSPVRQYWISARIEGVDWVIDAHLNDDGTFVLAPLVPGTYRVNAYTDPDQADSDTVRVRPGDEDVVLRVRPSGSLSGRVTDPRGGDPDVAEIVVAPCSADHDGLQTRSPKADGTFECKGLAPGCYTLTAKCEDGRIGRRLGVEVVAGKDTGDLAIALEPGAKIHVLFDGATAVGQFVAYHSGSAVAFDGIEAGTRRAFLVPAGKLVLRFAYPGHAGKESREVDLAPGEEKEITFRRGR